MIKTKCTIQSLKVATKLPKAGGTPIVVRPPQNLRCFRATIQLNLEGAQHNLYISTEPVIDNEMCYVLQVITSIFTAVPPNVDNFQNAANVLVLDRRGVGYMVDELYFYSDDCTATIVWEGESYDEH